MGLLAMFLCIPSILNTDSVCVYIITAKTYGSLNFTVLFEVMLSDECGSCECGWALMSSLVIITSTLASSDVEQPSRSVALLMELRKVANHPLLLRHHFHQEQLREMAHEILKVLRCLLTYICGARPCKIQIQWDLSILDALIWDGVKCPV